MHQQGIKKTANSSCIKHHLAGWRNTSANLCAQHILGCRTSAGTATHLFDMHPVTDRAESLFKITRPPTHWSVCII